MPAGATDVCPRVFKAHGLLYHSTLGLRVIKKKKKKKKKTDVCPRDMAVRKQVECMPCDGARAVYQVTRLDA